MWFLRILWWHFEFCWGSFSDVIVKAKSTKSTEKRTIWRFKSVVKSTFFASGPKQALVTASHYLSNCCKVKSRFCSHHDFCFLYEVILRHGALFNHLNGHVVFSLPLSILDHSKLACAQVFDEGEVPRVDLPHTWREPDKLKQPIYDLETCLPLTAEAQNKMEITLLAARVNG